MLSTRTNFVLIALLFTTVLSAQDTALVTDIIATPNYFVTVLFGVMLAIGFQFLLTSLSLAIGVTAIPNLKETYVESRYGSSNNDNNNDWNETNDSSNTGVMISSAFGIWNVITAALSLFGATALALTLTPVVTTTIAITLGLTIWSVFYLLMFYLEGKMVGTAIGSLISTAVSGLRAGADTVKSLFTPSQASQVQSLADNTIEKFRTEMSAVVDTDSITEAINNFTSKIDKNVSKATNSLDKASSKVADKIGDVPSYDQLKKDLQETMTQAEKQSGSNPAKWTAIQSALQTMIGEATGGDDGKDKGKKDRIAQLKQLAAEFQGNGNGNGKAADVKKQATQAYDNVVTKLNDFVTKATPDDFSADKLKSTVQSFLDDPQGTSTDVLDKVKSMDKQSVVKMLNQNTSLDKKQIENYANQLTGALNSVQSVANNFLDDQTVQDLRNKVMSFVSGAQQQITSLTSSNAGSSGSGGFDFAGLKNQFMSVINNPADTYDTVMGRIKNYRREDMVNALVANTSMSHADINKAVAQFEDAQNTVKDQLQAAADAANSATNQATRRAVIEADGARKAAVAASWWLFAAIVLSGVAAVFGAQAGI